MITISITMSGQGKLDAALHRVEQGVSNLKPLWEQMGHVFYAEEKKLFDAQPWTPLSEPYATRKRSIFGDKGILRASDALFLSLTEKGTEGNIHRVDDLNAEFGSDVPYGIFHQLGAGTLPKRDPMAEPDVDEYKKIADEYLTELVNKAGFN